MDQIDNNHHVEADIGQYISNNLSFQYSLSDQLFQENNNENTSPLNNEHEQNDNDSISMPIIYKKRVRTKFNQEQLDVLEATFQQHRYPTVDIVDDLVEQLNLPTQKITIWFQNRRARLKKTQQKLDIQPSFEKETQQQYDSGIHLDEDASHDSPASPPMNSISQWPPPPLFMTNPSAYYLPNPPYPFYNPMWSNFGYPFAPSTTMANPANIPYNRTNYNSSEIPSSFIFQDMSNYQHQNEFNGGL